MRRLVVGHPDTRRAVFGCARDAVDAAVVAATDGDALRARPVQEGDGLDVEHAVAGEIVRRLTRRTPVVGRGGRTQGECRRTAPRSHHQQDQSAPRDPTTRGGGSELDRQPAGGSTTGSAIGAGSGRFCSGPAGIAVPGGGAVPASGSLSSPIGIRPSAPWTIACWPFRLSTRANGPG